MSVDKTLDELLALASLDVKITKTDKNTKDLATPKIKKIKKTHPTVESKTSFNNKQVDAFIKDMKLTRGRVKTRSSVIYEAYKHCYITKPISKLSFFTTFIQHFESVEKHNTFFYYLNLNNWELQLRAKEMRIENEKKEQENAE